MSKSSLLEECTRGRLGDDFKCEVYPGVIKGHDVHDNYFQLDIENNVQEERKKNDNTKYKIDGSTLLVY